MTQLTTQDGTPVSRLTFGTMQFGGKADAAESAAMYDAARAAGITHFDTAVRYTDGAAEKILGQLIKHERDAIYLATKVGYIGGAGQYPCAIRHLPQPVAAGSGRSAVSAPV